LAVLDNRKNTTVGRNIVPDRPGQLDEYSDEAARLYIQRLWFESFTAKMLLPFSQPKNVVATLLKNGGSNLCQNLGDCHGLAASQ